MKEQDAAHSFEKIPWGKQEEINTLEAELTRLRSELQQEHELRYSYNEIVKLVREEIDNANRIIGRKKLSSTDYVVIGIVTEALKRKSKAK